MEAIRLRAGHERRLLRGHKWIFSNEIEDSLAGFEPGDWVEVYSKKGVSFGAGYINPHSLIAVRLVCPPGKEPTREFIEGLFRDAWSRRKGLYPDSGCYRVVFGESDGLPGLVVDRYEDVLVYQIGTVGMARMEPLLRSVMLDVFKPKALVCRNDSSVRTLEGLLPEKEVVHGEVANPCWVGIDGLEFGVDFLDGQKTGLFLDQRENRNALRRWAPGKRVLDLFCYDGGWALAAASAGAVEVVGVDGSAPAVVRARANASRNGLEGVCIFEEGDVFGYLKKLEKGRFDVIVLDPPAFAKSKASLGEAQKGYTDLNRRAMLALAPGGMLATCSCSYHFTGELMEEALLKAAQASGRQLRLYEVRGQSPDHPVLPAMPETRYLKCFFLEVF